MVQEFYLNRENTGNINVLDNIIHYGGIPAIILDIMHKTV